jgi:hypothetical protein
MLDKDPRKRPTVATVREQLGAMRLPGAMIARDSRPIALANAMARSDLALAATTATGPTPKQRRSLLPIILGVVALAAAAVGAFVVLDRSSGSRSTSHAVASAPSTPSAPSPPSVASEAPSPAVAPSPAPAPPVAPPPSSMKTIKHEPRSKVGTVVISVTGAAHARISIDGELVARGVRTTTKALSPGSHVVEARAKDRRPTSETIQVIAGKTQTIRLTLEKKARSLNAVKDPFEDE